MLSSTEILETLQMIDDENLDVRTVTMGINLLDCATGSLDTLCDKIYDKVTKSARNLAKTAEDISKEFGVPIIHKRISVSPIALVAAGTQAESYVQIAQVLDKAAQEVGVNFIGGFSALVQKGRTKSDDVLIRSIPEALAITDRVCSSVNVASTRCGINMNAVRTMGEIICAAAQATKERDSIGCAKLVVFCNAVEDNPFMAGAFHGIGERDCVINVGVSGPGVIAQAVAKSKDADFEVLCDTIKRTAFKITRVGQMVALEASRRLGVPFGIIDLSLAPTPKEGDSIAEILEEMGLIRAGAPGTTAALAMLTDNVKKGGIMASSFVGGLSGAFIPVSEDAGMIRAVADGALTIEKLEAMTAVCSVGLDMIPIPGTTSPETISGIIADEMAIGVFTGKTTAARLIPVIGKTVGEEVAFGGLLGSAPILPVSTFSCEDFIHRKGRIPPPVHSFRN
jgi:uncharacterized protein (UPF0210 family)